MDDKYIVPYGDQGMYVLNTAAWRTFRPVINYEKCITCGNCLISCPVGSINKKNGKIIIDLSYCKGCGQCREVCPKQCILWEEEK